MKITSKNLILKWFGLLLITLHLSCSFIIRSPFDPPKTKRPNWYRGIYHVHSNYSHDSKAPVQLIADTARKAGLDFVVITDHNNMAAQKEAGQYQDLLLIVATEVSTWYDGHLGVLGTDEMPPEREHTQKIIDWAHQRGGYTIPAHPHSERKPWTKWNITQIDGIELFCFSDFFYSQTWPLILKTIFYPPAELLKTTVTIDPDAVKWWDKQLSEGKRVAGFAAADAHLKFQLRGFHAESLSLPFQAVTHYVYAKELNEKTIVKGLGTGKGFMAFEAFGIAQDFSFTASAQGQTFEIGQTVPFASGVLKITIPQTSEIRLIHNGQEMGRQTADVAEYQVKETGYYRVEVYRDGKLWIISNPIYFETEPTV